MSSQALGRGQAPLAQCVALAHARCAAGLANHSRLVIDEISIVEADPV